MCARLAILLVAIAMFLGCVLSETDAATPAGKGAKSTVAAKQNAPTMTHIVAELHHAKHLLDHANHNYNHHRAHADHEIARAIHLLHHHHHPATHKPVHSAKPAVKHVHEPQQVSDAQLRQAEHIVRKALNELHKHHGEKAHEARHHLQRAVHEIELALHVHHHHHKKLPALARN